MTIDLVFVTYQRLEYTKLALSSVLADPTEEFSLTIWDNASTDGTADYLRNEVSDPRIADIILSKENVGQIAAVNKVWSRSKADLLGKLDNDCILTPGWTRTLAQAHGDIDQLGVIACWHYPVDEFDESAARRAGKIQTFGSHQILRHPWTCGTGLLIKHQRYDEFGPLPGTATTAYWMQLALAGYVNGFYYPLIAQEHMDDPRSEHCLIRDDESLQKYRDVTVVLRRNGIQSMKERWKRRERDIKTLNAGPWQAKRYVGLQGKIRARLDRVYARLSG